MDFRGDDSPEGVAHSPEVPAFAVQSADQRRPGLRRAEAAHRRVQVVHHSLEHLLFGLPMAEDGVGALAVGVALPVGVERLQEERLRSGMVELVEGVPHLVPDVDVRVAQDVPDHGLDGPRRLLGGQAVDDALLLAAAQEVLGHGRAERGVGTVLEQAHQAIEDPRVLRVGRQRREQLVHERVGPQLRGVVLRPGTPDLSGQVEKELDRGMVGAVDPLREEAHRLEGARRVHRRERPTDQLDAAGLLRGDDRRDRPRPHFGLGLVDLKALKHAFRDGHADLGVLDPGGGLSAFQQLVHFGAEIDPRLELRVLAARVEPRGREGGVMRIERLQTVASGVQRDRIARERNQLSQLRNRDGPVVRGDDPRERVRVRAFGLPGAPVQERPEKGGAGRRRPDRVEPGGEGGVVDPGLLQGEPERVRLLVGQVRGGDAERVQDAGGVGLEMEGGPVVRQAAASRAEVGDDSDVGFGLQAAERLDECAEKLGVRAADRLQDAVAALVVRGHRRVQQPVDRQVRIAGEGRQLRVERLLDGAVGLPRPEEAVRGLLHQLAGRLQHLALVDHRLGEEGHQPLVARAKVGRGHRALGGAFLLRAIPVEDFAIVLVLLRVFRFGAIRAVVLDRCERAGHVPVLVILPVHLAGVARIEQPVVVALVVEDDEAGQGLVDDAEERAVALEVAADEVLGIDVDQPGVDVRVDLGGKVHPIESAGAAAHAVSKVKGRPTLRHRGAVRTKEPDVRCTSRRILTSGIQADPAASGDAARRLRAASGRCP
jgi:hypothetical protein